MKAENVTHPNNTASLVLHSRIHVGLPFHYWPLEIKLLTRAGFDLLDGFEVDDLIAVSPRSLDMEKTVEEALNIMASLENGNQLLELDLRINAEELCAGGKVCRQGNHVSPLPLLDNLPFMSAGDVKVVASNVVKNNPLHVHQCITEGGFERLGTIALDRKRLQKSTTRDEAPITMVFLGIKNPGHGSGDEKR